MLRKDKKAAALTIGVSCCRLVSTAELKVADARNAFHICPASCFPNSWISQKQEQGETVKRSFTSVYFYTFEEYVSLKKKNGVKSRRYTYLYEINMFYN